MFKELKIKKKSGNIESFNIDKILSAIMSASKHTNEDISRHDIDNILNYIYEKLDMYDETDFVFEISVDEIHDIVIAALKKYRNDVAERYIDYHEFKKNQEHVLEEAKSFIVDKGENSIDVNKKLNILATVTARDLGKRFGLRPDWLEAINKDLISIDNYSSLYLKNLDTSVIDVYEILQRKLDIENINNMTSEAFVFNNIKYNEPASIIEAFAFVASFAINQANNIQYKTIIKNINLALAPYADKTYYNALAKYSNQIVTIHGSNDRSHILAKQLAEEETKSALQIPRALENNARPWPIVGSW